MTWTVSKCLVRTMERQSFGKAKETSSNNNKHKHWHANITAEQGTGPSSPNTMHAVAHVPDWMMLDSRARYHEAERR